jgi:hypothetical protein
MRKPPDGHLESRLRVMAEKPSNRRLPTQETQPKGKDDKGRPAKPETIPVPKRGEFFGNLKRVAEAPEKSGGEHSEQ